MNWKQHAECLVHTHGPDFDRHDCNAGRAAMIAEGERLQAELSRFMGYDFEGRILALEAENAQLKADREKLQAFKDYVHTRLDDAGVPVDPPSAHRDEGCRIGGRLDVLLADRERLREALEDVLSLFEMDEETQTVGTDSWLAMTVARAALSGSPDVNETSKGET
jgi:hypothetical protein